MCQGCGDWVGRAAADGHKSMGGRGGVAEWTGTALLQGLPVSHFVSLSFIDISQSVSQSVSQY